MIRDQTIGWDSKSMLYQIIPYFQNWKKIEINVVKWENLVNSIFYQISFLFFCEKANHLIHLSIKAFNLGYSNN